MNYRNHMSIFIGIVLCIFTSQQIYSQTRAESISKIKNVIKIFSSEGVGFANTPSKDWYAYIYLHHTLTNDELVKLTFDKKAEVRVYAYMALLYNKYHELNEITTRFLNDKETVATLQGCIGGEKTVQSIITGLQEWSFDNVVSGTLNLFNESIEFKEQVYGDLINEKQIKRRNF